MVFVWFSYSNSTVFSGRHLLSLVLQLCQNLRLAPRQQVLRARFAASVLHAHGLVVGEAENIAGPAVAELALKSDGNWGPKFF